MVLEYHGTSSTMVVHVYQWYKCTCHGTTCPSFAPSLNWLPCILPEHTWFSAHMCALFQSVRFDMTLRTNARTYVPWYHHWYQRMVHVYHFTILVERCGPQMFCRNLATFTFVRTIGMVLACEDCGGDHLRARIVVEIRSADLAVEFEPLHLSACLYVRTFYNVMSQLSDWKRAHMCTPSRRKHTYTL
jgi:hypothetical protein